MIAPDRRLVAVKRIADDSGNRPTDLRGRPNASYHVDGESIVSWITQYGKVRVQIDPVANSDHASRGTFRRADACRHSVRRDRREATRHAARSGLIGHVGGS